MYYYYFDIDLGNTTINGGGGLVLGRGPSPAIVDTPNLGPLAANSLLNGGFQSLSSSTSPILSQGAGKIISIFVYINITRKSKFCSSYTERNTFCIVIIC